MTTTQHCDGQTFRFSRGALATAQRGGIIGLAPGRSDAWQGWICFQDKAFGDAVRTVAIEASAPYA